MLAVIAEVCVDMPQEMLTQGLRILGFMFGGYLLTHNRHAGAIEVGTALVAASRTRRRMALLSMSC